mmetsp:Transcript_19147/g.45119  ORF Transcript_19147/g.45119 Transcript_19147/m.45119 type:complete len:262 (+) Transcript_19147:383-1168(+)
MCKATAHGLWRRCNSLRLASTEGTAHCHSTWGSSNNPSDHGGATSQAHGLLLWRLGLLHQTLLVRRHSGHDLRGWAGVATRPFDVVELHLLLPQHATSDGHLRAVHQILYLLGHIATDQLEDADCPRRQANAPQEAVVTSRVHAVEPRLDQKAVPCKRHARTTACFQVDAVSVLRLAQGTTREYSSTADIRLADDVEDFVALLTGHATGADAAIAERDRCLARHLKQAYLPLSCQPVDYLLLDGHGSAALVVPMSVQQLSK